MTEAQLNKEFAEIELECYNRMKAGAKEYGVFNPANVRRNLYDEIIEELYDTINYAKLEIIRLKHLQSIYEDPRHIKTRRVYKKHNNKKA